MSTKQDRLIISFGSHHEWEAWLADHHTASSGLWLKIAKKGSGIQTVSHLEALDVALCYGWHRWSEGQVRRRLLSAAVYATYLEE